MTTLAEERARLLARIEELDIELELPPPTGRGRTERGFERESDAVRDILLVTREHCLLRVNRMLTARIPGSRDYVCGGWWSPGGADLVGTVRACGHGLAVEVKAHKGRLEANQRLFAACYQRARGLWILGYTGAQVLAEVRAHVARCPAAVSCADQSTERT